MVTDRGPLPMLALKVVQLVDRGVVCGPCAGGWYQLRPADGVVEVLDPDGTSIDRWTVPPEALAGDGTRWTTVTVDAAGQRVVVTEADRTVVAEAGGGRRSIPHVRWERNAGAAAVDPVRGDLLWTVTASRPTGETQPPSGVVSLVDLATGEVVEAVDLADGGPEGYELAVLDGRGVVVNGSYGQDGSTIWFLRVGEDGRVERRELADSGVLGAVDPDRGDVLILPHTSDDLEIRTWWDGELLTSVDGLALFEDLGGDDDDEPDQFDYQGAFVGADHLVALTFLERALVLQRDGTPVGWVEASGPIDLAAFASIGRGRLLARGRHGTAVLDLDG